ncbi:MAG: hypothetical protein ABIC04_03790 [Nanoarchaeota archaeon]
MYSEISPLRNDDLLQAIFHLLDTKVEPEIIDRWKVVSSTPDEVISRYALGSIEKECEIVQTQHFNMGSLALSLRNYYVPRAYKNFYREALYEAFGSKTPKYVVEYGCGAAAFQYQYLPPEYQKEIQMFELNLGAVCNANNILLLQGSDKEVKLGNIFEMHKQHMSLDAVVCNSSYDATVFLRDAAKSLNLAMKNDGIFMHVQDVFPAAYFTLLTEALFRKEHGIKEPIKYIIRKTRSVDETALPIQKIQTCKTLPARWMCSIDYFAGQLVLALQNEGFYAEVRNVVGTFAGEPLPQQAENGASIFAMQKTGNLFSPHVEYPGQIIEIVRHPVVYARKQG